MQKEKFLGKDHLDRAGGREKDLSRLSVGAGGPLLLKRGLLLFTERETYIRIIPRSKQREGGGRLSSYCSHWA